MPALPAKCEACGVDVNEEIGRMTHALLASLDAKRKEFVVEAYLGTEPQVLCAECMNSLTTVVNTRALEAQGRSVAD